QELSAWLIRWVLFFRHLHDIFLVRPLLLTEPRGEPERAPGARMIESLRNERGMALVMAMLALLILSVLVVAFSLLASTEPTIASNQLRVAQARALAEAGVERAVWALTQGKTDSTVTGSLASPLPSPVPAPYNGSQLVSVTSGGNTVGGFYVNVTQDPSDSHQRWVQSVGWVPSDVSTDSRRARQTINVTLMDFPTITKMPCAVCVRGDIQIGGTSTIDSRPLSG